MGVVGVCLHIGAPDIIHHFLGQRHILRVPPVRTVCRVMSHMIIIRREAFVAPLKATHKMEFKKTDSRPCE